MPAPFSPHFSLAEFDCPCPACRGTHGGVLIELVDALEELRSLIGRPIFVNSGWRCAAHNAAVGGSPRSQHLLGRAADIFVQGLTGPVLYAFARRIPAFRGIGVAPTWIHVDIRQGAPARWRYDSAGRQLPWEEFAS